VTADLCNLVRVTDHSDQDAEEDDDPHHSENDEKDYHSRGRREVIDGKVADQHGVRSEDRVVELGAAIISQRPIQLAVRGLARGRIAKVSVVFCRTECQARRTSERVAVENDMKAPRPLAAYIAIRNICSQRVRSCR
jgi:hypothetical protein